MSANETCECAYWDWDTNTWSQEGVTANNDNSENGFTECHTTHLTNFALLLVSNPIITMYKSIKQ